MGERRHREAELFLVQFRSCPPSVGDAVEMHRALHRAVTRLGSAGTAIRWCAAWLLPDECRCLCLVQAAREADVVLARDLAALPTASVSPACALGGEPSPEPEAGPEMSATDARRPAPAPPGGLRSRVARRPLTAFLVLVAAVGWPLMSVPALTAHGVLPGDALHQEPFALGTTLLVMLPAALWVTAVADGPGAVRALLRRAVQWRFGAGWWITVLLALPVLTLAIGVAAGQGLRTGDLLATLGSGISSVVTAVLLVHLWEETVWAGFFQGRLEERHGFLPAAVLTAVPFAAVHLPLSFIGDLSAGRLALSIGALFVLGVVMRLLVGATVRGAAGSLLAAGLVHATFNASNNEGNLVDDLLGGGQPSLYAIIAAVLVTAGVLLALRNRH